MVKDGCSWGLKKAAAKTTGFAEEHMRGWSSGPRWLGLWTLLELAEYVILACSYANGQKQHVVDLHPCIRGRRWHSTVCSGSSALSSLTSKFVSWCQPLVRVHNLEPSFKIKDSYKNTAGENFRGHADHSLSQGRLIAPVSLLMCLNNLSLRLSNAGSSQYP